MKTYKIYIHPDDYKELQSDIWNEEHVPGILHLEQKKYFITIAYRGHSIRKHNKRSYNILFERPFKMNGEHEIHMNSEYKDPSLMRYKLSLDFFDSIGVLAPKSEHVLLSINGQMKGIYLKLESFDEYSLENRNLPKGCIYYATDNDANFSLLTKENEIKDDLLQGYDKKYDSGHGEEQLNDLLYKINTLSNAEFEKEIARILNIEKYLKWLAGIVCIQNFDGFVHNYALYKNEETNLFEISPWDCDGTWGRNRHGEILKYNYIPICGYNTLSARLLHIQSFRIQYRNILEEILLNHFTCDKQRSNIDLLHKEITPFISKDPYMKDRIALFESEPEFILEYIQKRNQYLLDELKKLS